MRNRNALLKAGAYVGFIGAAVFIVHVVFTSTSSTAPIGFLLIPIYGFLAAGVGWAWVYIIFALLDLRSGRSSWKSKNVRVAAVFLCISSLAGLSFLVQQSALSVAKIRTLRRRHLKQSVSAGFLGGAGKWISRWHSIRQRP